MRLRSIIEDLEAWWINTSLCRFSRVYKIGDATVRYTTGYSFIKDEPNRELVFLRNENMVAGVLKVDNLEDSTLPNGLYIVRTPGVFQLAWRNFSGPAKFERTFTFGGGRKA